MMEDRISDFRDLSLMVADDSQINHRIVFLSVKDSFKSIVDVFDGQEALDSFKDSPADVILMDAIMPGVNGYEATQKIRQYEASVSSSKKSLIIAMTASENPDDLELCKQSGMDAFLGKPFIKQEFFDLLKDLL